MAVFFIWRLLNLVTNGFALIKNKLRNGKNVAYPKKYVSARNLTTLLEKIIVLLIFNLFTRWCGITKVSLETLLGIS